MKCHRVKTLRVKMALGLKVQVKMSLELNEVWIQHSKNHNAESKWEMILPITITTTIFEIIPVPLQR